MDQTESMLATVNWLVRTIGSVVIAVETFLVSPAGGLALRLEIATFVLSTVVIIYWLVADLRGPVAPSPALMVGVAVMVAVSSLASAAPNGGALLGFAVMGILVAGTNTGARVGWAVTGTAILCIEIGAISWDTSTTNVVGLPLVLVIAFVGGRNRRSYLVQAEQSAALLTQLEQLRAEQNRVAVLDERTRIAREIHDVLAHSLGALGITIQAVRAVLTDDQDVDRALGLLEQAQRMTTDGLADTRHAVQALRGDTTRLDEQITALVTKHRALHHTSVDLQIQGTPGPLAPEATVALTRTAQEALVNTAKHAPRQPVTLQLRYAEQEVRLIVINELPEHPDQAPAPTLAGVNGGYGLTGMRERLLLIHGTLVTTADQHRWSVTAQVPQ